MAVHIFVVNEENYAICINRGLAAIPSREEKPNINDALISRMALIRKGDLILFYVIGKKELRGVFKVIEKPFYDKTEIWPPHQKDETQRYPFRVRFDNAKYSFNKYVSLSDIYDLKDNGKIWTFSLSRPNGTGNSLLSITFNEYKEIFNLFLKINPIYSIPQQIREPYRYYEPNLIDKLTLGDDNQPKYESTLMALLLDGFAAEKYKEIFGPYSDYIAYVPTSFNKEIDILLLHSNPLDEDQIIAYNIIEVKNSKYDKKGLAQLLKYEDWFLKKRVNGDHHMIRATAIASDFSSDVIKYLKAKKNI